MGFSSGTWTPPSLPGSWSPAISGQAATPDDWNTLLAAIAAGLSTMICKDGQSTVLADIPFAGFRLKGVGAGTLSTDAPNMSQLVSGAGVYAADTGTADVYAIAPTPAISAYAVGQIFRFKVLHTNLTTSPTLAVSGLTAGIIGWDTGPVRAGDLPINGMVQVIVASTTPTFHLQTSTGGSGAPSFQSFTTGTAATYTTPAGVKWLRIRMAAGGGGGGGVGGTTGPTGATGGTTTFNSINAVGGTGGTGSAVTTGGNFTGGGVGGTGGTGSVTGVGFRVPGTQGGALLSNQGGAIVSGGYGGGSAFFGGGGAAAYQVGNTNPSTGVAGGTNTGGGGGGAVGNTVNGGLGGGGGECVEFIISNPAGTYTYTVGGGGAGGIGTGTGAATGGAGGAGFIVVEEH